MANHIKPTKEELEEGAMKALQEAEAMEAQKEKEVDEAVEEVETPDDEIEEIEEVEEKKETAQEEEEEVKSDPKDELEQTKEELKKKDKKFRDSSREAQILYHRNKQVQEAIEKASELPDPTDEEMKHEYSEWEDMSDFEKRMAKESLANKRRLEAITEVNKQFKDLEEWQNKVDTFMDDPTTLVQNPALEGKEEDFKTFASKPTRRGVDFDILISSFLYQADKEKPKHTGKMFETGTGGATDKAKPKSDKITVEQARVLRKSNYGEYKRLLKEGKIESEF